MKTKPIASVAALLTFVLLASCSLQPNANQLGTPDLISQRNGDLKRSYLPDKVPEYIWLNAFRYEYYLRQNKKVCFENGESQVSELTKQERSDVIDTIARIKASTAN